MGERGISEVVLEKVTVSDNFIKLPQLFYYCFKTNPSFPHPLPPPSPQIFLHTCWCLRKHITTGTKISWFWKKLLLDQSVKFQTEILLSNLQQTHIVMIELAAFKLLCSPFSTSMDCSSLNLLRSFSLAFSCPSCGVPDLKSFGKPFKHSWGKRGSTAMLKKWNEMPFKVFFFQSDYIYSRKSKLGEQANSVNCKNF